MKKALVLGFVMLCGLGLAVAAQDGFAGTWNTTIEFFPAASSFEDFLADLESEIDLEYSVGGWVFGMESTFGIKGLTGLDFNADGSLGAFTFDADIDFAPMILASRTTTYAGLAPAIGCAGLDGVTWTSLSVSETYTAGFDDMKLAGTLSIAGVDLGVVFFMEGADNEYDVTYTGSFLFTANPVYSEDDFAFTSQTSSYVAYDTTKVGTGWKYTVSGSLAGGTATARAYFNLTEWSYNYLMAYYGYSTYVANYFKTSGVYFIACDDCVPRFTRLDLILEDVSFTCLEISAGVFFDCCGFSNMAFLIENIDLGCCWGLNFDLLIGFTATSKTLTIEPDITIANACLTIDAGVDFSHTAGSAFSIEGLEIYGIGLEYSWNGVTFTAETSWDLDKNPLINGGWPYYGTIESPNLLWVWQPDRDMTQVTFVYDEDNDTCTISGTPTPAINLTTGAGYYELTSFVCEYANVWEMYSIEVDGDSCCGGAFDIAATFYFGDVLYLSDLKGYYYFDANKSGSYDTGESYQFYGTAATAPSRSVTGYTSDDCNAPCPKPGCSFEVDEVYWAKTWTAKPDNRLFDWLRTDLDVSLGIGANFEVTFGAVIDLWGWRELSAGFEFSF